MGNLFGKTSTPQAIESPKPGVCETAKDVTVELLNLAIKAVEAQQPTEASMGKEVLKELVCCGQTTQCKSGLGNVLFRSAVLATIIMIHPTIYTGSCLIPSSNPKEKVDRNNVQLVEQKSKEKIMVALTELRDAIESGNTEIANLFSKTLAAANACNRLVTHFYADTRSFQHMESLEGYPEVIKNVLEDAEKDEAEARANLPDQTSADYLELP